MSATASKTISSSALLYRQYLKAQTQLLQYTGRYNHKLYPSTDKYYKSVRQQLQQNNITIDNINDYTVLLQCTLSHMKSLKQAGWGLQHNTIDKVAATARYVGLQVPKRVEV